MTKQEITEQLLRIFHDTPGNLIDEAHADYPEVIGLQLYDEPLIGFGDAADSLFEKYKTPGIVGPWMLGPKEWLPSAASVISVFMPFSERVKSSNARMTDIGSHEWAYARHEGQAFIDRCMAALAEWFTEQGDVAVVPAGDPRFYSIVKGQFKGAGAAGAASYCAAIDESTCSSNWSERHAAFVCGLGTFGLSRGLITAKGVAGRFGSLIVSTKLEADARPYTEVYEYCNKCGACAAHCPAGAFPLPGALKEHRPCSLHLDRSAEILKPRYGCGLCQVNVPCQNGIPKKD